MIETIDQRLRRLSTEAKGREERAADYRLKMNLPVPVPVEPSPINPEKGGLGEAGEGTENRDRTGAASEISSMADSSDRQTPQKKWREKNREHLKEYMREWRKKRAEEKKENL